MPKSQESNFALVSFRRLTGKQYPALETAFEDLSPEALRDLVRLVHDVEGAVQSAQRKGAREPWRNGL
jgi:hypothetical protein